MAARLLRAKTGETAASGRPITGLAERETEEFALVAEGLSNREIADCLVVSVKTVGSHRFSLMKKLDLHDSTDIVTYAIQTGMLNLGAEGEIRVAGDG